MLDQADGTNFRISSITIGADGLPIISYTAHWPSKPLKVAKCNDNACSGNDEIISNVYLQMNEPFDFNSIAIAGDGFPIIVFHQPGNPGYLKAAKCNDLACDGNDEQISIVDTSGDQVGDEVSLAIGQDGLPIMSYHDRTALKLKVTKCNDQACSGGDEISSIINDYSPHTGLFTSMTIGTDGLPIVSYSEFNEITYGSQLKVVKCNDIQCSGSDESISIVDNTAFDVGRNSSIAIGQDGLPIISYLNYKDGTEASDLRVVRCGTPSCN